MAAVCSCVLLAKALQRIQAIGGLENLSGLCAEGNQPASLAKSSSSDKTNDEK